MVPCYDELPELGDTGVRHAWNVWGREDRLGTMNRVSDETVMAALATPQLGRRVSLSLPLGFFDPPLYGRPPLGHRVFDRNRNMVEDELGPLDPQSSSQWDGLRHIRAGRFGHYGGIAASDKRAACLGIDVLARLGLVLRGVLLDLPRYWQAIGRIVDPHSEYSVVAAELTDCARLQGTSWSEGDLLMVRTGWLEAYRARGGIPASQLAMPDSAGLDASASMAKFLWDAGVAAVVSDNPAVEVLPGSPAVGSLHRRLIPALGMPLGELWDLDSLAAECADSGHYLMCVVSAPLYVPGAVASPANAFAIL